jgi:hypothetical protein
MLPTPPHLRTREHCCAGTTRLTDYAAAQSLVVAGWKPSAVRVPTRMATPPPTEASLPAGNGGTLSTAWHAPHLAASTAGIAAREDAQRSGRPR